MDDSKDNKLNNLELSESQKDKELLNKRDSDSKKKTGISNIIIS